MIFNDSTKSSSHGMNKLATFCQIYIFHSSRRTSFRDWMLDGEWCSTCLFRIPHRCSIGFRSGDILGHWITFTLFFFRNPTVALDVCLGSLSFWKSARRPRARSDGSIFSFSIEQYICEFMMPSMKYSSPTPAALMQPHIRTLPPPCFTVCTQYLVGAPFALITASIWRGMEVISLWHCGGGMEAQVSLTVAFS